jgi:hypothetical protein
VPGVPLGLLTNAVQTLAGVLLPSATVFLLLLCNDKAVLGPWANTRVMNVFTGAVIAALVMLSAIMTASVLFPAETDETVILGILGGGTAVALLASVAAGVWKLGARDFKRPSRFMRDGWRMPPLAALPRNTLSRSGRV